MNRIPVLVEKIVRHTYAAGRIYVHNDDAASCSAKAFHLARACNLADQLVRECSNAENARKVLARAFEHCKFRVACYNYSEYTEKGLTGLESCDRLLDFLTDDTCHPELTESMIKYFYVKKIKKIFSEKSREAANKDNAWLVKVLASVGEGPSLAAAE